MLGSQVFFQQGAYFVVLSPFVAAPVTDSQLDSVYDTTSCKALIPGYYPILLHGNVLMSDVYALVHWSIRVWGIIDIAEHQ